METPLITIITVVLNDEINIEETILSVLNQKYKNIQYIIIDGDSKDQTKNIIERILCLQLRHQRQILMGMK